MAKHGRDRPATPSASGPGSSSWSRSSSGSDSRSPSLSRSRSRFRSRSNSYPTSSRSASGSLLSRPPPPPRSPTRASKRGRSPSSQPKRVSPPRWPRRRSSLCVRPRSLSAQALHDSQHPIPSPPTLQQPGALPPITSQGSSSASVSDPVPGPSSAPAWGRGSGRRGPTRGITERRLGKGEKWNVSLIRGYGVGDRAVDFTSRMGVVAKMHCKIWQKNFAKLPASTKEAIFRDLQLTYNWERTDVTDKDILAHMTATHRSWRGVQKKRHYNDKSFDDAVASVPAGVDPSDWQTMCEMWSQEDTQRIADRNRKNRSHQSMPYRRGRMSLYQLKSDFHHQHVRDPHRLELFKMGRCQKIADGSEKWVDDESRRRHETMLQLMAPPSSTAAECRTPLTAEEAFISVMGKDRPGRVRCAGSAETLNTWYGWTGASSSSACQKKVQEQATHMHQMEERLKAQEEEMTQMRAQQRTQLSEMEQMRTQLSQMEQMGMQMQQMKSLLTQITASQTPLIPAPVQSDSKMDDDEFSNRDDDHEGGDDC